MACGSGKLISDLVLGQAPEISTEGLANRYQQVAKLLRIIRFREESMSTSNTRGDSSTGIAT